MKKILLFLNANACYATYNSVSVLKHTDLIVIEAKRYLAKSWLVGD